jgi:hypothetical protein
VISSTATTNDLGGTAVAKKASTYGQDQQPTPSRPGPSSDAPNQPQTSDPWDVSAPKPSCDCGCQPPQPKAPRPCQNPPRAKPKPDDCCRQLIDLISKLPGIDQRVLNIHKPKTKPKVKVANLCCAYPVKERITPMLLLILRRYRDGVKPGNSYEAKLQGVLSGLPAARRTALEKALDAYDGSPAGARDCAFEIRFDDWPNDKPLDPGFFAKNLAGEIIALGRMIRFGDEAFDQNPIGTPRPWSQSVPLPGEPGNFGLVTAPWPWICAVGPNAAKATDIVTDWYRNESSCVPGNVPRGSIDYHPHEFAYDCSATPSPGGSSLSVSCVNTQPSTPAPGGFGFGECPGGADYRVTSKADGRQVCLKIPQVDPGSEVGLRGLNFLSANAMIHVRRMDGVFMDIPLIPLSDWNPDTTTPPGTATCAVRDHAYFVMPDHVNDGLNDVLIPPGRYAVQMIVPNVTNFAPAGGGPPPASFVSNEVLINLQPSANLRYLIATDEAFCYEETDGWGSDEPWFKAMTAVMELPNAATDNPLTFPLLNALDIMNTDDVDSGEWISFPGATLFSDVIGRRVFAAAVIGLEVDDDDAAKEAIDSFWEAYAEWFKKWYEITAQTLDSGFIADGVADLAKTGLISTELWASGAVMAALVGLGALFAWWAPADEIAIDSFVYNPRQLFDMTDPNSADAPAGDDFLRIKDLRMTSEPLGKKLNASGEDATYSERRHYYSTSQNSHYGLVYRFKRA